MSAGRHGMALLRARLPRLPWLAWLGQAALFAAPLVALVLAWEALSRSGWVRPLFLPAPSAVLAQFAVLLDAGEIVAPLSVSLLRAAGGLALAAVVGVVLGLAMARSPRVHWLADPLVSFGFPTPKIALMPIFILWFGIDHLSKILLVALTCVFPVVVASYHGASALSRTLVWSAQAMGTPPRRMLTRVVFPATLPFIFSGLRVTVPVALITAYAAEMVAGGGGLGATLMYAQRLFQTPTVFVDIVLMLLTGVLFDQLLLALRRRLLPWQPEED